MEVRELRLGNLAYLTAVGHESEVIEWGLEDYEFYEGRMEDIEPIPLTEKWLLDFGFKKFGKDTFYLGKVKIHHRKRGFVIAKRYADINYVHQLQNLYFALTKKELTIK